MATGGGCQGRSNPKHTGKGPSYRRISKQSLAGWAGSRGNGGGGKSAQWDCLPALVLQLPLVCLAACMSGASLARPCQCEKQETTQHKQHPQHRLTRAAAQAARGMAECGFNATIRVRSSKHRHGRGMRQERENMDNAAPYSVQSPTLGLPLKGGVFSDLPGEGTVDVRIQAGSRGRRVRNKHRCAVVMGGLLGLQGGWSGKRDETQPTVSQLLPEERLRVP